MKLTLDMNLDNAAFDEDRTGEVARILRDLATRIDGHPHFSAGHSQPLRDINGNEVGHMSVVEEVDLDNPPTWVLGQDPQRCDQCGTLLEECGDGSIFCAGCDECFYCGYVDTLRPKPEGLPMVECRRCRCSYDITLDDLDERERVGE